MERNPFSAGKWVREDGFFGRTKLLSNLLHGSDPCYWVIGKRRVGKTSLLRQLEWLINQEAPSSLALYWDIQGSYDSDGMLESLLDAIEDSQDQFEVQWQKYELEPDQDQTCHLLIKKLARQLQRKGVKFFLLIDEAEELITVGKKDPVLLSKLRRFFQTARNTQTTIASTPRLEQLHEEIQTETSPFLHGFTLNFLGHLEHEAADQLLGMGNFASGIREKLIGVTGGNPFELQLAGKHFFEHDDLEETVLYLETNPMLQQTFEVNYGLLLENEQNLLRSIHAGTLTSNEFTRLEKTAVIKMLEMGYLKTSPDRYLINSSFQEKFLDKYSQVKQADPLPSSPVSTRVLAETDSRSVLQNLLPLYKLCLEMAQSGKRLTDWSQDLLFSPNEHTVQAKKEREIRDHSSKALPWQAAIESLSEVLKSREDLTQSWSIHRFFQMLDHIDHFNEQDFLNLLILISEEADLD